MTTITPTKASYQIGETVSAVTDGGPFFFTEGNTLHLHIILSDGVTYGDVIATAIATGPAGAADFGSFTIPSRATGDGLQWVVREPATLAEDFGEVFTLLPAAATRGGTRLTLGHGLGL